MNQIVRSIFWSSLPLIFLAAWFILVAVLNWDYQVKFFEPVLIGGHSDPWLGPILLATAIGFGIVSCAFVFLALRQKVAKKWVWFSLSILVSTLLFLMALALLLLGPAAITMKEQMALIR